ncbi:MAG: hypothetical protein ABIQ79_04125 [Nitrospiraceae bacterium]
MIASSSKTGSTTWNVETRARRPHLADGCDLAYDDVSINVGSQL